jgi:spoIIIJ-associated protein
VEWVVTTGRSLEEATEAALDELGVDEDELDIEILEEPRPGLFGRVRGEAKIRARVKPTTPRPKVDRRDRRRRNGGGSGSGSGGGGKGRKADDRPQDAAGSGAVPDDEPPTAAPDADSASASTAVEEPERRDLASEAAPATTEPIADTDAGPVPGRSGAPRRRRSRSSKPSTPTGDDQGPRDEGDAMTAVSVEEQVSVMQEFLEGLLDAFDVDGDVSTVVIDEETSELQIEGDDLGLLIGPKGQTLSAIQDLARTVAQRKLPGSHEGRVRVDVSGYRQRRREALERFAQQVAEDVRASGSQKVLEPMNAADRKVVHDVINGIEGVSTTSEGEEPRRRVVVLPAD